MNSKSTRNWIIVAIALFVFIFFFERHLRTPETGPLRLMPELKPTTVNAIQVRHAGQLEIRAERTNGVWHLTRPISYPAQTTAIESLLEALQQASPVTPISTVESRRRSKFDQEHGFDPPQVSIGLQHGEDTSQIWIGAKTAPGDQVFVQVVGIESVYVVDAELLKLIPRSVDEWRDTTLVDPVSTVFDRIIITAGGNAMEFQLNSTNKLWGMTRPLQARADNSRINELLQQLQAMRVTRFVTDNPEADMEAFGLQPPEFALSLANGTNVVAALHFGKSTTNNPAQLFARRDGIHAVVTVPKDLTLPWRADVNEFRDHRLLSYDRPVNRIEIHSKTNFVLEFAGSGTWKIESENLPVDAALVNEFIRALSAIQIVQFKDAVTGPDLADYGLESPSHEIVLLPARADGIATNDNGVRLSFGKVQDDTIFVRRSDEDPVYAVKLGEFQQFPTAPWQLRERRLWRFSENDVTRVQIRQGGNVRELIRGGTNSWGLAPGSQGDINTFGVEETVHRLGELAATAWISPGDEDREKYGFSTNGLSLTVELKNGERNSVEFGDTSETQYPYAAAVLDGQTWIFQFPIPLYQFVLSYLALPAKAP
jgi:hypothetical protein